MDQDQYQTLCRLTDEILMDPEAGPIRIAIPWLHVIREHPDFLSNYENIFVSDNRFIACFKACLRSLRNKLSILKLLIKSIFHSTTIQWSQNLSRLSNIDVLFISHLLNKQQFNNENDFYFSNLPKKLSRDGYRSLMAMMNHSGVSSSLYSMDPAGNSSKLVFSDTLGIKSEMKNLMQLWKESRKMKKIAYSEQIPFKKIILLRGSIEALSSASMHAMRFVTQIEVLIEKTSPAVFIATHEGHAWERIAFFAARKANPSIHCVGYTHAPLFERQHAVKRPLADIYNPDQIFTSGPIQKIQLVKSETLKIPIEVLGSARVNEEKTHEKRKKTQNKKNNPVSCLVIPEGINSEIHLLFDFSLRCARKFSEIKFLWRLHPLTTFENLTARRKMYQSLPSNISLSEKSLEEDFQNCQWVLYRGSSAVIQAVVAGLKPIYLRVKGEMNIDPLYELEHWKSGVGTIQDFEATIKSSKYNSKYFRKVRDYCSNMYVPYNHKPITNILEGLKNNG